jgi:peptidoglycan/xylan/chitin deacetylase (PgdA/CDA1 family)
MTLKSRVRDGLDVAAGSLFGRAPFLNATRAFFNKKRAIVFYHAVWKQDDPRLRLFGGVQLDQFESDIERLSKVFDFVSLSESLNDSKSHSKSRPTIALTFDDGFDLIAGGAADVLDAKGISATLFVNTDAYHYERILWQHALEIIFRTRGEAVFLAAFNAVQRKHELGDSIAAFGDFIGASKVWPQEKINLLADEVWTAANMSDMTEMLRQHRPYMSRDCLMAWIGRGHKIGFHGKSHLWSSSFKDRDLESQLLVAGRQLKDDLGLEEVPFAYSFGDRLTQDLERVLADSGVFTCALGTDRVSRSGESPFETDRIELDFGLDRYLFGRPLIRALRGQDIKRPG